MEIPAKIETAPRPQGFFLHGRTAVVFWFTLTLLWTLCARMGWAQSSVSIVGVAPAFATPGQLVVVTLASSGVSLVGCALTLTAQGQQTPVLTQPTNTLNDVVLPSTLTAGVYIFEANCNGISGTATINVTSQPPTITEWGPTPAILGGQSLTIKGLGFEQGQGNGSVRLIGTNGLSTEVDQKQVITWKPGQIVFNVPATASVGQYLLVVHTDSNGDSPPVSPFAVELPIPAAQPQQPWASVLLIGPAPTPTSATCVPPPGAFNCPTLPVLPYSPTWKPMQGATKCDANQTVVFQNGNSRTASSLQNNVGMYCNFPQVTSDTASSTINVTDRTWQVPVQIVFQDDTDYMSQEAMGGPYVMGSYTQAPIDLNDPVTLGNKGNFRINVAEFGYCAAQPPGATPTTCQTQTEPPQTCPLVLKGPDGNLGCWFSINTGQPGQDDFFGPTAAGVPTSKQAVGGGFVAETVYVPVRFLYLTEPNYVAINAIGFLGDTRAWPLPGLPLPGPPNPNGFNFAGGVAWNAGPIYDCNSTGCGLGYTQGFTHPSSGSFNFSLFSATSDLNMAASFEVRVLPIAMEQLKAVPYTILYQPPGNNSTSQVFSQVAQGTSYSLGYGDLTNSGATSAQQECQIFNNGIQLNASISSGVGVSTPLVQYAVSGSSCTGVQETNSTAQAASNIDQASLTNSASAYFNVPYANSLSGSQKPQAITSLTPGITGLYENEPFWYDYFVLNLNQPYLVFLDNGVPTLRLLPVVPWTLPQSNMVNVTLLQLLGCAYGISVTLPPPYGGPDPKKSGAFLSKPFSPSEACYLGADPTGSGVTLDASEAQNLIALDPFFPGGQSTDPSSSGSNNGSNPRATQIGNCPAIQACPGLGSSITNLNVSSQQNVASFTAGVSSFQAFAQQNTFTLFGNTLGSEGPTGSGSSAANASTAISSQVSYSTSSAMSTASTLQWLVFLQDYRPTGATDLNVPVKIYQDNVFGTPMFQDAHAQPLPPNFHFSEVIKSKLEQWLVNAANGRQAQINHLRDICSPWPSCIMSGQNSNSAVQQGSCTPSGGSPQVTTVTPDVGPANGGITVTIKGRNFCGATSITVGGRPVRSFAIISAEEARAELPALPATVGIPTGGYSVDVAVCTSGGCSLQYVPGNFKYLPK